MNLGLKIFFGEEQKGKLLIISKLKFTISNLFHSRRAAKDKNLTHFYKSVSRSYIIKETYGRASKAREKNSGDKPAIFRNL